MATSISLWERYYLRPMTNRDITRLNLYHELLANRYLLSIVLTNLMNTNKYLEVLSDVVFKKERKKEQKEKGSHTLLKERKEKKKERTIAQSEKSLRNIEFNSFTLSPNKFDALLREYDHDVVTDACVVLDKLIGIQGKTYKDIPRKLEELCKQFGRFKIFQSFFIKGMLILAMFKSCENSSVLNHSFLPMFWYMECKYL